MAHEEYRQRLDESGQTVEGILSCPILTDYAREILFREVYPEFYQEWQGP